MYITLHIFLIYLISIKLHVSGGCRLNVKSTPAPAPVGSHFAPGQENTFSLENPCLMSRGGIFYKQCRKLLANMTFHITLAELHIIV